MPLMLRMSRPPAISWKTLWLPSSLSRLWSTYDSCTVGPIRISPESGFSCPVIILNRVDLPAPFGPMMPTIAPGGTIIDRLSISRRSPNFLETLRNSITELPRRSPGGMKISLVSLRFW